MPIYEYECAACSRVHEVMQKFSDPPMTTCPDCGGSVAKKMSVTSFALKGSGWYTSDYKRAGQKPEGAPVAPAAGDAKPGTTAAGADAKPGAVPAAGEAKPSAPASAEPAVGKKPASS